MTKDDNGNCKRNPATTSGSHSTQEDERLHCDFFSLTDGIGLKCVQCQRFWNSLYNTLHAVCHQVGAKEDASKLELVDLGLAYSREWLQSDLGLILRHLRGAVVAAESALSSSSTTTTDGCKLMNHIRLPLGLIKQDEQMMADCLAFLQAYTASTFASRKCVEFISTRKNKISVSMLGRMVDATTGIQDLRLTRIHCSSATALQEEQKGGSCPNAMLLDDCFQSLGGDKSSSSSSSSRCNNKNNSLQSITLTSCSVDLLAAACTSLLDNNNQTVQNITLERQALSGDAVQALAALMQVSPCLHLVNLLHSDLPPNALSILMPRGATYCPLKELKLSPAKQVRALNFPDHMDGLVNFLQQAAPASLQSLELGDWIWTTGDYSRFFSLMGNLESDDADCHNKNNTIQRLFIRNHKNHRSQLRKQYDYNETISDDFPTEAWTTLLEGWPQLRHLHLQHVFLLSVPPEIIQEHGRLFGKPLSPQGRRRRP